ncbi:hypothetical protein QNO07_18300 [Streptomyces sp. 549]|uniref:hypothetical protein n=1 Tax=Streptomyces sp. 549 TaxID=3049076 RepID=UPI0024C2D08B|nr:hypothetical protein [Streptomyces sp. 549]MDK1475346.1 hypothetical protein [Streptomyces sp. 549]
MSSAGIRQGEAAAAAVLYVCVDRGSLVPTPAARRAREEGHAFARERGLTITEVVTDRYGEPDPRRREGWQRVRELAEAGTVATVLVRWPAAIAPESSSGCRHRETVWLREHGVRVRYTWAPLATTDGESR